MSEPELQRLEVLSQVANGTMSVTMAAEMLGMSARQVPRLLRRLRTEEAAAIRHKARGRRSNNRVHDGIRDDALTLIRKIYADFGPTLAAGKLAERHGLAVSRETLRKWMIAECRCAGMPDDEGPIRYGTAPDDWVLRMLSDRSE